VAIITRDWIRTYSASKGFLFAERKSLDNLGKRIKAAASRPAYDVFLSHRYADREELSVLLSIIETAGISVFVDWRDSNLSREHVTRETASSLKDTMQRCKALLFVITSTSSGSIWMPWELGLFDGMGGKVAIVPIARSSADFPGQEYAGLYPWIDTASLDNSTNPTLWVNFSRQHYVKLNEWLAGTG